MMLEGVWWDTDEDGRFYREDECSGCGNMVRHYRDDQGDDSCACDREEDESAT